jgi:hypothetical protein
MNMKHTTYLRKATADNRVKINYRRSTNDIDTLETLVMMKTSQVMITEN